MVARTSKALTTAPAQWSAPLTREHRGIASGSVHEGARPAVLRGPNWRYSIRKDGSRQSEIKGLEEKRQFLPLPSAGRSILTDLSAAQDRHLAWSLGVPPCLRPAAASEDLADGGLIHGAPARHLPGRRRSTACAYRLRLPTLRVHFGRGVDRVSNRRSSEAHVPSPALEPERRLTRSMPPTPVRTGCRTGDLASDSGGSDLPRTLGPPGGACSLRCRPGVGGQSHT